MDELNKQEPELERGSLHELPVGDLAVGASPGSPLLRGADAVSTRVCDGGVGGLPSVPQPRADTSQSYNLHSDFPH